MMSPFELTPTLAPGGTTVPRIPFSTRAAGSVKLSWAQAPPTCAPMKQLVQLNTGTGATSTGRSAARAGAATADSKVAALPSSSFFIAAPSLVRAAYIASQKLRNSVLLPLAPSLVPSNFS
jgi:hypothetical protein